MNLLLSSFLSCYPKCPEHRAKDSDEENDGADRERRKARQQEYEAALHLIGAHGYHSADHGNTKEYESQSENPKSPEANCQANPTRRHR